MREILSVEKPLTLDEIRKETTREILQKVADVLKYYKGHKALIEKQPNVWKGTIYAAMQWKIQDIAREYGIELESEVTD